MRNKLLIVGLVIGVIAGGVSGYYYANSPLNADGGYGNSGGNPYGGRVCSPDGLPVQDALARQGLGVEALNEDAIAIKEAFEVIIARLKKNQNALSGTDMKPVVEAFLNKIAGNLISAEAKKFADQIADLYGVMSASELYGVKFSSRISENGAITLSSGKFGNKPYVPLGAKQSTYLSDTSMDPLLWQKGLKGSFNASVTGNLSKVTAEVSGSLDYGFKFSKDQPATIKIGFKCLNGVGQYGLWSYDQKGSALALPEMHVTLKQGDASFTFDYKDRKDYGIKIGFSQTFGVRK